MWGCSEGVRVREFKDPAEQQDPFSWVAPGNGFWMESVHGPGKKIIFNGLLPGLP